MNCREALRQYVEKALQITGLGMKALIMDRLTTLTLTQLYTMSQLAKNEVFLVENLQDSILSSSKGNRK